MSQMKPDHNLPDNMTDGDGKLRSFFEGVGH